MVYKELQGAHLPWVLCEKSSLFLSPLRFQKANAGNPVLIEDHRYLKSETFKMWNGATMSAQILCVMGCKAPILCRILLMIKNIYYSRYVGSLWPNGHISIFMRKWPTKATQLSNWKDEWEEKSRDNYNHYHSIIQYL